MIPAAAENDLSLRVSPDTGDGWHKGTGEHPGPLT